MENNWKNEFNEQMQEGYDLAIAGNGLAAIQLWIDLWNKILDTMQMLQIHYVDEFDKAFDGEQYIGNWAIDFDVELENASRKNKEFAQMRIDFCTQYISKSKDHKDNNILEMRRAIAESYFELGNNDKGERLFKEYTEQHPDFGWYWIGWSDQYGLYANEGNQNFEKAIDILKQALKIEGLRDRFDVLERLDDLYMELGKHQEAAEVRQDILDQMKAKNASRPKVTLSPRIKAIPVTSVKIGRNDPCTCGSGQKYKKCCGR
ncbi:SEC-C metal-binding domain-containing protein [Paenibacillus elgii]